MEAAQPCSCGCGHFIQTSLRCLYGVIGSLSLPKQQQPQHWPSHTDCSPAYAPLQLTSTRNYTIASGDNKMQAKQNSGWHVRATTENAAWLGFRACGSHAVLKQSTLICGKRSCDIVRETGKITMTQNRSHVDHECSNMAFLWTAREYFSCIVSSVQLCSAVQLCRRLRWACQN